ncbi:ABC transporter substrate-binding protein [Rhodovulum visakhapatnamense]|uniref:Amino acid/amide ABC transporter substrate-binding protein (HAAT family) n=1 Tax=Rhodovulum visakhapatnamense TaxID=364297 RepID=A0A4R8FV42_9RHOB|nr:penicillin-binding protein activator [Rhodovulum visakhapatnamense]TDX30648.1 amino acid/amide ABC transporter substrate-binding protein (HAAT family) [Rhodovulum visakhapatnamense]
MAFKATLLAAGAALALAGSAAADPVKVGMITTLSGGGASLGIDTRDGFMLAVEAAANPDLTVVIEDDQQKPEIAVQLADKLIQSDKVDVLTGIVWSNLAMAVVPAATAQGKTYLSTNAAPSQLAGKGCNPGYFSVSYQNDNLHEAAGAYAATAGIKRAFIMAPNYPAGKDSLSGFKRFYEGEVVSEVYTQLGQTDYAGEIAQIRASGADGVFIFLPGGMGISFVKQYADSGVGLPLIGPAFSFDQSILQAMGDAAVGVLNGANWSPDLDTAANATFVESFRAAYGRLPSVYAAYGYDTANLLLSAMAKAPVSDAEAFRAALKEADFASVRGKFSFAPSNHPIQDLYVREVVKEGDIYTNKIVGTAMTDRGNPYEDACKM